MQKTNDPLDTLKEIILLYANTPPDPIENLRLIEKELLSPYYLDACGQCQIWEDVQSQTVLSIRIETVIRIHDLGLAGAEAIHGNQTRQDEFMAGIMGYADPYPPTKEQNRKWVDSAFHEIYGYSVATHCPCIFPKREILGKAGFVSVGEDPEKPIWIKDRLNCLQCNHLHFVAILEDLAAGSYRLLGESGIVERYHRTTSEDVEFCNYKHQRLRTVPSCSYTQNDAAFPYYFDGMPCNLLVNLLSSGPWAKKPKRCPICEKFFFANDAKRVTACYDEQCEKSLKIFEKWRQREENPNKYGRLKPLQTNVPEYNRLKAIWDKKGKK